ncbi:MAG: GFA family protein [Acidobacteria bacterium]|mgnify:CR=1 FL=1|nr:MAG: GFA family protein [Acidobacteriota bacterium]REK07378.1 MAG: GFA family protein [Acidobacteriota bacterium]
MSEFDTLELSSTNRVESSDRDPYTGGCQCGAVRYRVLGELTNAHVCHCRMCQKAAGNYFMPLANAQKREFVVVRGEISWFQSSEPVRRGFCEACGTPLIFDREAAPHLNVTLGSLDDPAAVRPTRQYGLESRLPWLSELDTLPGETTEDADFAASEHWERIRASNRQHPDHES